VPDARQGEVQIRPAAGMVDRILAMDRRLLAEARAPGQRFIGKCRHFSTLTVALLRAAGVASRARCGFVGYFEEGRWVDHWIVEHWDGGRWVRLDPQLDDVQVRATGMADDASDLPPGLSWQRGRPGSAAAGVRRMGTPSASSTCGAGGSSRATWPGTWPL